MEYGTMELPPRVIRQLVTQQVRRGLNAKDCARLKKHCMCCSNLQ
jgi:hypothetical protein